MTLLFPACAEVREGDSEPAAEGTEITTTATTPVDLDGDGWTSDEDCDDQDGEVSPGAEEFCDGEDNDCDGDIDESDALNREEYWPDEDGDGYGDGSGLTYVLCASDAQGYVQNADDCDDTDAEVHPGADESDCGLTHDLDCDGGLPGEDGDGDGYAACEDCDDDNSESYPGAPDPCLDCEGSDEMPLLFASDFESEPEGMILNGDASLEAGLLRLTAPADGSSATALLAATVASDTPMYITFSAYLCCNGSDGIALALLDATEHDGTAIGNAGGQLGVGGLFGHALTLDTYRNFEFEPDDVSANALGLVDTLAMGQLDALDLTEFAWDDAVPRAVAVTLARASEGVVAITVSVEDVPLFETTFTPASDTWRVGFTAGTGSGSNVFQGVDDVAIHACEVE